MNNTEIHDLLSEAKGRLHVVKLALTALVDNEMIPEEEAGLSLIVNDVIEIIELVDIPISASVALKQVS
ncbi:MAG: hypothetical protein HZA08_10520 [Nitrospirae bacterium]|nr:hypothetical protein [Nitrospirota bacterium]